MIGFSVQSDLSRFSSNMRSLQIFLCKELIYLLLLEMFYLNSTLNLRIPPVLVFQLVVYYKVDGVLTGLLNKKEQLLDGIQIKHFKTSV